MDPETLNPINENLYRAGLMMIQYITIIVGLAIALYILVALVALAYDFFGDTRRLTRRQMDTAPEPDAKDLLTALAGLDESFGESQTVSPDNRSTAQTIVL